MKAQDIITHMMRYLPQYSTRYSSNITPTSIVVSGTTVTMVFAAAHGVVDGGIVNVHGALIENPIDTIDDSGDNIVFTTTLDHDITYGWTNETQTVNLTSVTDPSVNGDYTLLSSINRRTFEIATFPDTALADVVLNEPRSLSINGTFNIDLISDTSFSFELDSAFAVDPNVKTESVSVDNYIRISGGVSIDRIEKAYTEQSKHEMWAFVVLGDTETSKDRNVSDDATLNQRNMNAWNVNMMQDFAVFLFVPSKKEDGKVSLTGRYARDLIEDERVALYKALLGTEFDTGFAQDPISSTVPNGDGLQKDANAYIIYRFNFQQVAEVTSDDIVNKANHVALRDISIDYLDAFRENGNIIMEADVNTDESPAS